MSHTNNCEPIVYGGGGVLGGERKNDSGAGTHRINEAKFRAHFFLKKTARASVPTRNHLKIIIMIHNG